VRVAEEAARGCEAEEAEGEGQASPEGLRGLPAQEENAQAKAETAASATAATTATTAASAAASATATAAAASAATTAAAASATRGYVASDDDDRVRRRSL
jgi:hypothetical protein